MTNEPVRYYVNTGICCLKINSRRERNEYKIDKKNLRKMFRAWKRVTKKQIISNQFLA